jgi:hypothetical protein
MHTITTDTLNVAPFDKVWVQHISMTGNPNGKTSAVVVLLPYNGTHTLSNSKTMIIDDVFAQAAADNEFADMVTKLLQQIEKQAKIKGII